MPQYGGGSIFNFPERGGGVVQFVFEVGGGGGQECGYEVVSVGS